MSDQPTTEEQQTEEQPEAPKTYSEWRKNLHQLFGGKELTGEDKEAADKAGISSEVPWVSDHKVEASSESGTDKPDPNQPIPGQPTSQVGETSDAV
jgi:hypothetical protein